LIGKQLKFKIFLFAGLILLFVYEFTNSVNENEFELDDSNFTTNLIDDEIKPYCKGLNYSLEGYSFADIETLVIEIKDSRKWYKNLVEIYSNTSSNVMDPKFKEERFTSNVTVKFIQNFECSLDARIRISGDMSDHVEYGHQPKASLDVHLDNGNILGITKFKLFLDDTRGSDGGENEVLVSSILRHIGYIAPRTAILPVIVNGSQSSNYIFQEKAAKEMIEFHGFREGPILVTNEKYLFEFKEYSKDVFDQNRNLFLTGRVSNENWLKKNIQNITIGTEALQLYNEAIYSSYDPNNQLNYESLNTDTLELYLFDALNFALNAKHGIINHNRKFLYDKISENFIPIYYDGNSGFLSEPVVDIWSNYKVRNKISEAAIYFLEKYQFNSQDLNKELSYFRLNYDNDEINKIIENLYKNLNHISTFQDLPYSKNTIIENLLNAEDHKAKFVFLQDMKYMICSQYLTDCSNYQQAKNLTSLLELIDSPNMLIFGNNIEATSLNRIRSEFISLRQIYKLDTDVVLYTFNNPNILIDKSNRILNIFIDEVNQKALINGDGALSNWKINIDSSVKEQLSSRQDSLLLTGCLTISGIEVDNLVISSNNQHCEDAVNLIRTSGNVKSLIIQNSMKDGFDVDYSILDIIDIEITNSGNDCLDLSGGQYTLNLINISECSDKGISVGENSLVSMSEVSIINSFIAIAMKDSSKVTIKDLYSQNVEVCIAMYRKKQEFGPSFGLIKNNMCDSSSVNFIQTGSYFDG